MRITDNVELFELDGKYGILNSVLVWDDKDVVLIDTGLPEQLELIRNAVEKTGFSLERITKIILTHLDEDHVGCAKHLRELGAEIMAHEKEVPYIQGDSVSPKLLAMAERLRSATEEELAYYASVQEAAPKMFVHVDRVLKDGEALPFCGGIEVIHTPGHTPGHISLLLKSGNILVTGDAANASDGILTGPNPEYTLDMPKAQESFEKLKKLNPDFIICYHGGVLRFKK